MRHVVNVKESSWCTFREQRRHEMTQWDLFSDNESHRSVNNSRICQRFSRSPKNHTILEGTSEIQQLVIARAITGLRVE